MSPDSIVAAMEHFCNSGNVYTYMFITYSELESANLGFL